MSKVLVIIKSMGIGDLCILISNIHAISKKIGRPVSVLAQKNTRARDILKYDKSSGYIAPDLAKTESTEVVNP